MERELEKAPVTMQLPVMYVAPGRSLAFGYAYAADLEAFTSLRKTVQADGVALDLLYTYFEPDNHRFFAAFVLDFTNARADQAQIAAKIDRLPRVQLVDLQPTADGMAASEHHQLQVAGMPMVLFGRPIVGGAFRRLAEAAGKRAPAKLFEAGQEAGRQAASGVPGLLKTLGEPLTPDLIRQRIHDLQVFGWATVVHVHDGLAGEVLLKDDFEAAAYDGQATEAQCHWLRGFISGALSSLSGKPYDVAEPECQAKGDRFCRMQFRPR